jgi:transposase InsO family protein
MPAPLASAHEALAAPGDALLLPAPSGTTAPTTASAKTSPLALSPPERQHVLQVLNSERFQDQSPSEVFATLLDEGIYVGSVRTMYRILDENHQVRERRNQRRHPVYAKPELVATGVNQVWSWDITKLKTWVAGVYLNLYVILDIYSRYVVGWTLDEHESAQRAKQLIEETYRKHNVEPGRLILHADGGPSMTSGTVKKLLARLDVGESHSRPHVSNDNPFSESQFKTMKYRAGFPERFRGVDDALTFCRGFFPWYNDEHHHSAREYLTPLDVHYGRAETVLRRRHETMLIAYHAHPERFFHKPPTLRKLAPAVYINPPKEDPPIETPTDRQ